MMKTLGHPETFFKQNFKKGNAMLLVTGFATVSQIANHCQLSCYITKFVALELTNVTSQVHVINFNIRENTSDFIGHHLPKDYIPDPCMGPHTMPGYYRIVTVGY